MAKLLSGTRIYGNTTIDTYLSVGANVSANSVKVTEYYEFSDGTKQYTANAGLSTASGAYNHANGAFDKANSANVLAQSSFDKANSANVLAQVAYDQANTGTTLAQAGFDKANSANVLAQSAFDKANSGVLTVSLIDANNDVSNVVTTVTGLRFDSDSGFDVTDLGSGNVKIGMNSTFKTWKVAGQTDLVATGLDTVEFKSANGISITTGPLDNPKSITFDGGPLYDQINTKFNSTGGSISGSVSVDGNFSITGNLTVVGQAVYANTQTVLIADNIITLNAAIDQSALPTSNAGITIDRGAENNVYILYSETNDYWHFTNDGIIWHKFATDSDIITVYDSANAVSNIANSAYDKANAANVLAQAAFDAANSAAGAGANSFGIIATNNATVLAEQANDTVTFYGDGGISVGADALNKRIVISVPAGYVFNSADYGWVDEPTTTIFDYGTI